MDKAKLNEVTTQGAQREKSSEEMPQCRDCAKLARYFEDSPRYTADGALTAVRAALKKKKHQK